MSTTEARTTKLVSLLPKVHLNPALSWRATGPAHSSTVLIKMLFTFYNMVSSHELSFVFFFSPLGKWKWIVLWHLGCKVFTFAVVPRVICKSRSHPFGGSFLRFQLREVVGEAEQTRILCSQTMLISQKYFDFYFSLRNEFNVSQKNKNQQCWRKHISEPGYVVDVESLPRFSHPHHYRATCPIHFGANHVL